MFGIDLQRFLRPKRPREAGADPNGREGAVRSAGSPPAQAGGGASSVPVAPSPRVIPMREIEELCEIGWTLAESGELTSERWHRVARERDVVEALADGALDPWIRAEPDGFSLTEDGRSLGKTVVRRHRLAERLLTTVLDLKEEEAEASACEFEHILSPSVTDRICGFLGHPPVCPHGKPIPAGECCLRRDPQVRPLISRLVDTPLGQERRIAFIIPSERSLLSRLSTLGIVPGHLVRVKAHRPSYVIEVGETVLALDAEVAGAIYVRDV